MTPRLRQLVMGQSLNSIDDQSISTLILQQVYKSCVEVIIQSVENTTRDLREMLRLLRMVWPFYLKPLLKDKQTDKGGELLQQCISNYYRSGSQDFNLSGQVSEILGQRVRPFIRRLINECLLQPGQTLKDHHQRSNDDGANQDISSLAKSLPYHSKFLLLAAYLCQANKADHDQKLYTNKASGRRRQSKNKQNDNFAERITHASSMKAQQSLRSERVSSFPLERLLSIYSSISGKYAVENNGDNNSSGDSMNVGNLGSIALYSTLAELRQLGFLSCMTSNILDGDKSRTFAAPWAKFVCHLSKNDAEVLSKEVKFPLRNYLAENM